MDKIRQFFDLPFHYHIMAGVFIRLSLIAYSEYHDQFYDVPYTDVDYKVFTDAARYVLKGESPYRRHTYRYSPIIAYMMIPNILIGEESGKILFSFFDIMLAIAIRLLVHQQLTPLCKNRKTVATISMYCAFTWLYNPTSIGISTRGNADSVPCFFIVLSLLFLLTDVEEGMLKYLLSGFLLGFSIHLRLYPLVFSFPMYLCLGNYKITRRTSMKDGLLALIPNKKQICLTLSCVFTLLSLTGVMYSLYQYEFLFETYIYHLFRKDTRHNFSVLFYYSYLTTDQLSFDFVKILTQIFEFLILFVLSLAFGCEEKTLPFALFTQAIVLVAFNSVLTSQYFIWFLSLLPLVVHSFNMTYSKAMIMAMVWTSSQGAWLFYAYQLEFQSQEVFIWIWLKSIVFFCANIYALAQIIKSYSPNFGFGIIGLKSKLK